MRPLSRRHLTSRFVSQSLLALLSASACLTLCGPGNAQGCVSPAADQVAWWRGEGDAGDSTGNHDGALHGGTTFAPGLVGQSFAFNAGAACYVEVPDAPELRLATEVTIECWVRRQRFGIDMICEKGGDWTTGQANYGLSLHDPSWSNSLYFFFQGGGRFGPTVGDFGWHHVAVTARHGDPGVSFYLDGVPQPTWSSFGASTVSLYPSTRPLHIGAQVDPSYTYYGSNLVDELSIHGRALTAAEIAAIFAAGSAGQCRGRAPSSDAGADQTVDEGALVSLDGSASSDPDGDPLTYAWTQVAGTPVALSGAGAAQPAFTAPWVTAGGETLTFQLIVYDAQLASAPDTVDVTVKNVNTVPVADAGDDQTVSEGAIVTLDGSASFDADAEALSFVWSQVGGTPVGLSSSAVATPSFVAPAVGATGDVLTFELMVSDGVAMSAADQVQIFVTNVNNAPVADAGDPQTVDEGSTVALDGTASGDPDGDPIGYSWSQLVGPMVALDDPLSASPTFVAPDVTGTDDLVFSLTVFDSNGAVSAAATARVTVRDVNAPPSCGDARPSVGDLWPPNHKMVEVSILGVVDPEDSSVSIAVTDVWQDEPTAGLGAGDSSPDAILQGDRVLLRAERDGAGDGRVYHISFTATDSSGAQCSGQVVVTVPHDRKKAATDGGALHDSTR